MRNLKVRAKLGILIVIALAFILVVGIGGNQMTQTMAGNVEDSYKESLLPLSWLRQIQTNERSIDAYTLELMLISDAAGRQAKLSKIQQLLSGTDALIDQYASAVKDSAMLSELAEYKQLLTSYRDVQAKAGGQALQGDGEGAYAIYADDTDDLREQMTEALAALAEQTQQAADDMYAQSKNDARMNGYVTVAMIAAALVLLSVVSWLVSRAITKPLGALREWMKRAAAGDMTVSGGLSLRGRDRRSDPLVQRHDRRHPGARGQGERRRGGARRRVGTHAGIRRELFGRRRADRDRRGAAQRGLPGAKRRGNGPHRSDGQDGLAADGGRIGQLPGPGDVRRGRNRRR
ncbi:MCP four helix bundle domain-containing protein [Cohnella rhizosphaerae]|uniref:MCP four helix bundle domain-containing protein n=1 Tax=Cohnella rhizosphaerae TaxID=1457232 RepID=A0A9X4QXJ5_9BACL|nr:MCP four helix bundle domain-containing protein [Cohnella rhizosphaerae]MDG0814648.1 MCP four helix bundle domain-containing protein [Cohnella rhizosphaerae]